MNKVTESYAVQFWAEPMGANIQSPMKTTECKTLAEASTLEKKFHAIGWPARAVIVQISRVDVVVGA